MNVKDKTQIKVEELESLEDLELLMRGDVVLVADKGNMVYNGKDEYGSLYFVNRQGLENIREIGVEKKDIKINNNGLDFKVYAETISKKGYLDYQELNGLLKCVGL